MPIFYQHDIDAFSKIGIWKIEEGEDFFLGLVEPQRHVSHPHKKLQHLAGRYLLKYLFPEFPTELIRVADTRKPFLEDDAFHFSISHCGDYAAAIVSSKNRVGVDIEIPTDKVLLLRHKFLHEEEQVMAERWGKQEYAEGSAKIITTLLWSAKEAMFKWWGWGQIDFSEMLRISGYMNANNFLQATFRRKTSQIFFPVHYMLFPGLVLTWVKTDPKL